MAFQSLSSNWLFKSIILLFIEGFETWLPATVSIPIYAIIPEDSKVYVYDPFINLALKYLGLLNSDYLPFNFTFATHSLGHILDFVVTWIVLLQRYQTLESQPLTRTFYSANFPFIVNLQPYSAL